MNHSESDVRVSHPADRIRGLGGLYVIRGIVALVSLLIAVGITAVEWLASDAQVTTYSVQRQ